MPLLQNPTRHGDPGLAPVESPRHSSYRTSLTLTPSVLYLRAMLMRVESLIVYYYSYLLIAGCHWIWFGVHCWA